MEEILNLEIDNFGIKEFLYQAEKYTKEIFPRDRFRRII